MTPIHDVSQDVAKRARRVARLAGFSRATYVMWGRRDMVVAHMRAGYRRKDSGAYVNQAVRERIGRANTYYQSEETLVMLVKW